MAALVAEDRAYPATDAREARDLFTLRDLYVAHFEFVRASVLRLGGPRSDSDDLVQEVFLVAMKRRRELESLREPRRWLYGVAVRVVAAGRRRGKLRRFFGVDADCVADPATPHQAFERREASQLVYRALDRLSERKRTVFVLYEIEGFKGEEIAALLRCPLKTVWSRLGSARLEFSRHLTRLTRAEP